MSSKKILVAYFSASGRTEKLAKTIQKLTGGDLYEIEPSERYTAADLNWMDKKSRSTLEMQDLSSRPSIKTKVEDIQQYDTILVGFPIWWYVAPTIINTFLESYDFSSMTVIPFATSGGSGFTSKMEKLLHDSCSNSTRWEKGRRLASLEGKEVENWLSELGLL